VLSLDPAGIAWAIMGGESGPHYCRWSWSWTVTRPTAGRPHLGPVPGPAARCPRWSGSDHQRSIVLQDRLLVRETAPISGRWTWAGCVTCGTAASACRFRCSSNRSADPHLRQAGACWTAAPGTSIRHERGEDSLLPAALPRIGRQHSMRTNRLPSLVIAGVSGERSQICSRLLLHPTDGTSGGY
jgi:hypothetical protein